MLAAGFRTYEYRRLRLLAEFCRGRTVLDLGYAALPNPYLADFHSVGLDLEKPRTNNTGSSDPRAYDEEIMGDVTHLQDIFAGRTFDNIVAGEFIEHLEKPYDFLRSLVPLITRGGRLILSTPNPLGFPVLFFELLRSKRFYYTRNHLYYFSPRWVERMLDVCGYKVLRVKGVGLCNPIVPLPCPASMSYQVIYVASCERKSEIDEAFPQV